MSAASTTSRQSAAADGRGRRQEQTAGADARRKHLSFVISHFSFSIEKTRTDSTLTVHESVCRGHLFCDDK